MIDQTLFRSAMARLGAAVTVITSDGPAGRHGFTASAVCSVTDTPPTVLVCINRASKGNETLRINGVLCVNILAGRHEPLSGRFAARDVDMAERFGDEADWMLLDTGAPVLKDATAALDCRIAAISEVGSHNVLFCEVQSLHLAQRAEGLIYFNRAYHHLAAESALSPP